MQFADADTRGACHVKDLALATPRSSADNPLAQFSSQRIRAQVSGEYIQARDRVAAFTSEDSGSAYLAARDGAGAVASRVAGQPRNPQ